MVVRLIVSLSSAKLIIRSTGISKCFIESLDFEITRVDCIDVVLVSSFHIPCKLSFMYSLCVSLESETLPLLEFQFQDETYLEITFQELIL